MVRKVNDDEQIESLMHKYSNEVNEGSVILVMLRYERCIKATPPPLPAGLGLWMIEKLGGVRELSVEGRVSDESQVSDRDKISRF
jgi:hypothetical protein